MKVVKVRCEAADGCPDNKPDSPVVCPHSIPHEPIDFRDVGGFDKCDFLWKCRTAKCNIRCIPVISLEGELNDF